MKENDRIKKYPYIVNCAGIKIYKSNRKNAAFIDNVCFNHLYNKESTKITDNRIYEQFIYVISDLIYTLVHETNNNINIAAVVDIGKNNRDYTNNKKGIEINTITFDKKEFTDVKELLYFVYILFCLVYPYNTLMYDFIVERKSVKYWIKYYNKKGNIEL